MTQFAFAVCPLLCAVGCTVRQALRDDADVHARGRALALAASSSHGGLDRWRTVARVAPPDDWLVSRDTCAGSARSAFDLCGSGFSRAFEFVASWEDYRVIDGLMVDMRRGVAPKPLTDAAFAWPVGCS